MCVLLSHIGSSLQFRHLHPNQHRSSPWSVRLIPLRVKALSTNENKISNKPSICTADELHYVSVKKSDWRVALWRYNPSPEAPRRNHPLMLLSGVGTNAIGYDLSPEIMGKGSKGKDVGWKYGEQVPAPNPAHVWAKCNYCGHICKGGVSRLKHHLAGTKKDVSACNRVPPDVKDEMLGVLKSIESDKKMAEKVFEEEINIGAHYDTGEGQGISGPMDKYVHDVNDPTDVPINPKKRRENVCLEIGRFFFENGIPFHAASSPSFTSMVRSIGRFGKGIKPPSAHDLSTWVLKSEVALTEKEVDNIKLSWKQTGVTIMSDGWKDMRGRHLINFLVNNPYGTVFLRSIDASDAVKDAQMIFELLDAVVEEVGEHLVTQVVTDNASNYKAAGKLLMAKRKSLWWTPCAAHCIDLILEKIGELPQHKNALLRSKQVSNYIYNHGWVLRLMRDHTNKDLVRPAATRFATAYLTLQSMYDLRADLELMFASRKWSQSSYANKDDGKRVKRIVMNNSFWTGVSYAIKTTRPLVDVLRMVDSEKMPSMGFVYGAMEKAKKEIASNLGNEEGAYNEIWSIIDQKWEFTMHRDLHSAAYYLNPHYHFDDDYKEPFEVRQGLMNCMAKMIPEKDRTEAHLQLAKYENRKDGMKFAEAMTTRKRRSPHEWWTSYGQGSPELMSFAVRVLSLTASSSACERNWSTFNQVHTKKRNRLTTMKLNSLVYIMYNKKLATRRLRKLSLREDEEPLVIDEMPSDIEWVAELDDDQMTNETVAMDVPLVIGSSMIAHVGSTESRKRKKHPTKASRKDKGKAIVVDEEDDFSESESDDGGDDDTIPYDDDSMEDPLSNEETRDDESSFARYMCGQGFDTWILEVRGAGLSMKGSHSKEIEQSAHAISDQMEAAAETSTDGFFYSAQQYTNVFSGSAEFDASVTKEISAGIATEWDQSRLVTWLTQTFICLSERLSDLISNGQSKIISAKLFDQISRLLEDSFLSERFNEIRMKLSVLLESRQNSAAVSQIWDLSQKLVNILDESQRSVSPQLFDMHERLTTTIEDFQKQLDLIIKYDWDFDHYLEEDIPAAMEYIRAQTKPKDGKLLAIGHSMGGILLYAMLSRCGSEERESGLASIITLASSLDYTSSESSLKLLLPLADPAQALNVPVVPLGALLTAAYPLSSHPPYVLSWLNPMISAQGMMHPKLLKKLFLNNFGKHRYYIC